MTNCKLVEKKDLRKSFTVNLDLGTDAKIVAEQLRERGNWTWEVDLADIIENK